MSARVTWFSRSAARAGRLGIILAALAGCEHGTGLPGQGDDSAKANDSTTAIQAAHVPLDPQLHQTFAQATRAEPPEDWQRPPDLTLTGKSVGKLYTEVTALWDSIHYSDDAGRPISYRAALDTELGPIEITLRPDLAPNHVRNFIALARAGYYDGLVFERTVHARAEDAAVPEVEIIEAGCPIGTGDLGVGSLGYWLKSEFSKEAHDAGTVGACHGVEKDTDACRFYVTLGKAPLLDGNFTVFGKVTAGLDIARRIFSLPVRNDPEYPEGDRPEKPVVIRKVTISTGPAETGR